MKDFSSRFLISNNKSKEKNSSCEIEEKIFCPCESDRWLGLMFDGRGIFLSIIIRSRFCK